MTGFFGSDNDPDATREWVLRIHRALSLIGRLESNGIKPGMVKINSLRKHHSDEKIESVIAWFESHAKDKWTPVVFSANSFVAKFKQLHRAMIRNAESCPSENQTDASVDVIRVSLAAGGLAWPGDEKQHEAVAIGRLLNDIRLFHIRLDGLASKSESNSRLVFYIRQSMPSDIDLAVGRLVEIHRMAWEWEGWSRSGILSAMRLDRPWFRKMLSGYIRDYRGSGNFTELISELLETTVEN